MAERQNKAAFDAMLTDFPPDIRDLAQSVRALILDIVPGAFEVVWPRQRIAGYGTGPKKMTEHFCWLSPHTRHVDLGFNYGSELPDPHHLLEGTGRLFRHIKMRSPGDVERSGARDLVQVASRHRVPPLPED